MESSEREQEGRDEGRRDDTPKAVGTYDEPIAPGPTLRTDLDAHPDRSMVIETSWIRGSDAGQPANLVLVPVEIGQQARASPDSDHMDRGNDRENQPRPDKQGHPAEGSGRSEHHRANSNDKDRGGEKRSGWWASTIRPMLIPGIVALVFGMLGAFVYSHFFGSGKSGDQQQSGKDSGSDKKSSSSQDSGSGQDSGSSKGSRSGKGSNPGQGPAPGVDSNMSGNDDEKQALMTAMRELQEARGAEKSAKQSADEAKAVLEFFKATFLSAGRPGDTSLAKAFWSGGQGKDVSLRKAADLADSKVDESFANRPLAEAAVREMLGLAYMNLGDAPKSVREYERALDLRRAMQGFGSPETANCRNQLAVAYRLAGRADDGARLFDHNPDSPTQAAALAAQGMTLLLEGQAAEAELKLRACLEIRQKAQPDDWATFDVKSSLGEALLNQGKYADAEPLLLSGYEGLKHREVAIPQADRSHLTRAIERLVRLYDAWGKKDDATRWKEQLKVARSADMKT